MRNPIRLLAPVMLSVISLGVAACGSSDPSPSAGSGSSSQAASAPKTECTADNFTVTGPTTAKPQLTLPASCSPPTKLLIKDVVAGTGQEAKAGSNVTAHYLLVTWSDRAEKDSSWKRGEPYTVQNLGQASVIDGWNQGLVGMKQGTRRLLVVPPALGYGAGGNGIRPNETLVFVIDAVQIS